MYAQTIVQASRGQKQLYMQKTTSPFTAWPFPGKTKRRVIKSLPTECQPEESEGPLTTPQLNCSAAISAEPRNKLLSG